ncbi:unnamed protein product [Arctogadus glacialis]
MPAAEALGRALVHYPDSSELLLQLSPAEPRALASIQAPPEKRRQRRRPRTTVWRDNAKGTPPPLDGPARVGPDPTGMDQKPSEPTVKSQDHNGQDLNTQQDGQRNTTAGSRCTNGCAFSMQTKENRKKKREKKTKVETQSRKDPQRCLPHNTPYTPSRHQQAMASDYKAPPQWLQQRLQLWGDGPAQRYSSRL